MSRFANRVGGRFDEAWARKQLVDHVLIQASHGLSETWWLVEPRGCWQMSACLTFTPNCGITITGDLIFGENRSVTAIGYDRNWFVSGLDADYLCVKFLRDSWQPEIAATVGKELVCSMRRSGSRRLDTKEKARELWDVCDELERDRSMSAQDFGESWCHLTNGDWPDFGHGYNARDAENLIAVQHRFRQRWWELHGSIKSAEAAA